MLTNISNSPSFMTWLTSRRRSVPERAWKRRANSGVIVTGGCWVLVMGVGLIVSILVEINYFVAKSGAHKAVQISLAGCVVNEPLMKPSIRLDSVVK